MDKRILIVEDEKNIVDILSFNLSKEGYETLEPTTRGGPPVGPGAKPGSDSPGSHAAQDEWF